MIRQDHRGRLYRVLTFTNYLTGKVESVNLPYTPIGAPPAKTIPVKESTTAVARSQPLPPTTGFGSEERRPVVFRPKRLHVLFWRDQRSQEVFHLAGPTEEINLEHRNEWDWHVQFHLDEGDRIPPLDEIRPRSY